MNRRSSAVSWLSRSIYEINSLAPKFRSAPRFLIAEPRQLRSQLRINGPRLNEHLRALAEFGKNPQGGVSRLAYSDADFQGREYVMSLMRATKLNVSIDAAGNLVGQRAGSDLSLPPLAMGSDIDSVPDGGNYDGDVGSLGAIEVAQTLAENNITLRHPLEVFRRIDALFNVAGISGRSFGDGPVHECTDEGWDRTIDTNVKSMFFLSKAVINGMLEQQPAENGLRGSILNMASVLAFSPEPRYFSTHAYAASKGAILGLSKAMAAGPYTLSGRLIPNDQYQDRYALTDALLPIVRSELQALVATGAREITVDEPSMSCYAHREDPARLVDIFNRTVESILGKCRLSTHLCFGNYKARAVGPRRYRPMFPAFLGMKVDEIHLEMASREFAEVEIIGEIAASKDVAVGIIDVKSYYIETLEEVAARVRSCLAHVPAERMSFAPDCGLSQTACWAARLKLKNMVAGVHRVRQELGL